MIDAIFANALVSAFVSGVCCVAQHHFEENRREERTREIRDAVREEYEKQKVIDREAALHLAATIEISCVSGSVRSNPPTDNIPANASLCSEGSEITYESKGSFQEVLDKIEEWSPIRSRQGTEDPVQRRIAMIKSDLSASSRDNAVRRRAASIHSDLSAASTSCSSYASLGRAKKSPSSPRNVFAFPTEMEAIEKRKTSHESSSSHLGPGPDNEKEIGRRVRNISNIQEQLRDSNHVS